MKTLLRTSLLLILSQPIFASELLSPLEGIWGIGVSNLDSNYKGEKNDVSVAPYIFGSYGDLRIEANRLMYPLYKNTLFSVSGVGQLRTQQYSELFDRDRAIELGLAVDSSLVGGVSSRLTILGDVSDTHNGYEVEAQLFKHFNLGSVSILGAIGLQYQGESLGDYYYATPVYKAGDGLVGEAEVIATYPIGDYALFTGVRNYWYGSNVTDSPIASGSNTLLSFAGVGYRF